MRNERKEYPRPQFRRDSWQSLNGEWEFDFGENCGMFAGQLQLNRKINVPFSYQWEASGIGDTSVHDTVWYRRKYYTQLTDVQLEVNGLLYADRTPKTDLNKLKKIFENK